MAGISDSGRTHSFGDRNKLSEQRFGLGTGPRHSPEAAHPPRQRHQR